MTSALSIECITKRFRKTTALDRVSFEIPQGEIFGLLGPNGAGKTTLMRVIVGILGPDEGIVRFAGNATRRIKERIGYLPEERGLYQKMKSLHLLRYFAAIKGVPKKEIDARIEEGLERVGLAGQEKRKVEELSKGNQQRIQLLMTLIHKPDFLVLDEPFTGLDPIGAQQMKDILIEETRRGATVVISTHRMEDAEELCGDIALIHQGRVIRSGSLRNIKREEGRDELSVQYAGELNGFGEIEGAAILKKDAGSLRLSVVDGASIPAIVRRLSQQIDVCGVQRFEPTLHDIFVRLVKGEEQPS